MNRIKKKFLEKFNTLCYEKGIMANEFDDKEFLKDLFFKIIGQTGEIKSEKIKWAFNQAFDEWFKERESE